MNLPRTFLWAPAIGLMLMVIGAAFFARPAHPVTSYLFTHAAILPRIPQLPVTERRKPKKPRSRLLVKGRS